MKPINVLSYISFLPGHIVDVVARELLEVEDAVVLEHGLDVGPVSRDTRLVLVVLDDEGPLDVGHLPDDGLGRGLAQHVAHVDLLAADVEGQGQLAPELVGRVVGVVHEACHA